ARRPRRGAPGRARPRRLPRRTGRREPVHAVRALPARAGPGTADRLCRRPASRQRARPAARARGSLSSRHVSRARRLGRGGGALAAGAEVDQCRLVRAIPSGPCAGVPRGLRRAPCPLPAGREDELRQRHVAVDVAPQDLRVHGGRQADDRLRLPGAARSPDGRHGRARRAREPRRVEGRARASPRCRPARAARHRRARHAREPLHLDGASPQCARGSRRGFGPPDPPGAARRRAAAVRDGARLLGARRVPRPPPHEAEGHGPQVAPAPSTRGAPALDESRDADSVAGLHPTERERTLDELAPWILGALLAAGALLRLIDLGQLSFRWDEDLSSLAAKAIAERGVPELPSGMIYLRSLPFLYVLAGSGALLGFDEWGLRLPSVLFGTATIGLAYVFGKRLFGTAVGLVLAALVTFSAWEIEFSRYARMYAPFEFFYVLTLLSIWRHLVADRRAPGAVLSIACALVALSLHDLAYTLALAFLLPLLIDGRRTFAEPARAVFPLAGFVAVAAGFLVWGRIQNRYFYRPAELAAQQGTADASAVPADLALRALEGAAGEAAGGPLALVGRIAAQVRLPDLPAFSALFE